MSKALSFDDISLVPRFNNIESRKDVDTTVQFGDLEVYIPIFSSNMDTVTGPKMAETMGDLGGLGFLHRFCSIEDNVKMWNDSIPTYELGTLRPYTVNNAVVSLGINEGMDRFLALHEVGAKYFCIDIAHGHSKPVGKLVNQIKEFDESVFIVAGNVCEPVGAAWLADRGADAIKIGIGPGSVCSTRVKTGFGVPQFTAIKSCRRVNAFLIADGGIRTPGDAVKAFFAGADAVMLGGMLSGTDETPGEIIMDDDEFMNSTYHKRSPRKYKVFRGMASKEAQDEYMGTMGTWKAAEGVEIRVAAKGPVSEVVSDLMGGIRSGMTYCGANNLRQIRERADYVEVSPAGAAEGRPHGQGRL